MFERFWRRDLDIESIPAITAVLREAGADATSFPSWSETGRADVARISQEAEALGVFGVPSFVVNGELFWGREHLPDIRELIASRSSGGAA